METASPQLLEPTSYHAKCASTNPPLSVSRDSQKPTAADDSSSVNGHESLKNSVITDSNGNDLSEIDRYSLFDSYADKSAVESPYKSMKQSHSYLHLQKHPLIPQITFQQAQRLQLQLREQESNASRQLQHDGQQYKQLPKSHQQSIGNISDFRQIQQPNLDKTDTSTAFNKNISKSKSSDIYQLSGDYNAFANVGDNIFFDSNATFRSSCEATFNSIEDEPIKTQFQQRQQQQLNEHNDHLQPNRSSDSIEGGEDFFCSRHSQHPGQFFCKDCDRIMCSICLIDDNCISHEYFHLASLHEQQTGSLKNCEAKTRSQLVVLREAESTISKLIVQLRKRYDEMVKSVERTYAYFAQVLQERRDEVFAELEVSYTTKVSKIQDSRSAVVSNIGELNDAEVLIDTLLPLPFNSKLIGLKCEVCQKIDELVSYRPDVKELTEEVASLNFYANRHTVRSTVRNAFGFVGSATAQAATDKEEQLDSRQIQIGRNLPPVEPIVLSQKISHCYNEPIAKPQDSKYNKGPDNKILQQLSSAEISAIRTDDYQPIYRPADSNQLFSANGIAKATKSSFFGDQFQLSHTPPSIEAAKSDTCSSRSSQYQSNSALLAASPQSLTASGGLNCEETSKSIIPNVSIGVELRRVKMEYHCKFGEFGSEPGQFTEPSGVAVGRDNEILVADANNHRIQAFDSSGVFRRIIGQEITFPGQDSRSKCEGDLVYPNRLAVNRVTGDIYVTERSPTHQVRVYDGNGRFVRRFGAHVLQHPRGITVDRLGRIIVIECKVMRVVIFNSSGSVLNRFVVEKKVNFPNGVAVNDREEIFISDNRRHGVVVFDYQGAFLRTIGGIGVTNYPIGVGINMAGEVVVADNHNNFNVTLFTQDGKLIRALESRVKHAQCFDTALMGDGSIVLSSKDFRIYIYHYASYPIQVPVEEFSSGSSGKYV